MKLILPLSIPTSKAKKLILNLNNYRNAHHFVLNKAKQNYSALVQAGVRGRLERMAGPVHLHYKYFHGNKRKVDVSNPCSIIDKFTCDALTAAGIWPDDNAGVVKLVTYEFGGVDKNNPRCELTIRKADHVLELH